MTTAEEQAKQLAELAGDGFAKKGKSQWKRFVVFDGSICIRHDEEGLDSSGKPLEGPIETQNPTTKANKETWVERFDSLVVQIVDINVFKKEFDKSKVTNINLTVQGPTGKRAILQMSYAKGRIDPLLKKFLKVAPNIDFNYFVRISAFKNREKKQVISIKQGTGPVPQDWPAVPWYWEHKLDDHDRPDFTSKARGADGSIMPPLHVDEDDDGDKTYDSKEQDKFLLTYFKNNVVPRIKDVAKQLGIEGYKPPEDDVETPEFSGPAEKPVPVVTTKPAELTAHGMDDAMMPSQASVLRKLAKRVKKDPDALVRAILKEDIDFDDLSVAGAAYLVYKINRKLEKDPEKYPDPDASVIKKHLEEKKASKASEIDDEWDEAVPAKKKAVADDDDDDWGEVPKKKAAVAETDDDDDDDDIPF